jgi:hypothetical protein
MLVAGNETGNASTLAPDRSTALAGSVLSTAAARTETGFMARGRTVNTVSACMRVRGANTRVDFVDLFSSTGSSGQVRQQIGQFIGMFCFRGENLLHHAARGRVLATAILADFAATVSGDGLAVRSSLIMLTSKSSSTYSTWLWRAIPSGAKSGAP